MKSHILLFAAGLLASTWAQAANDLDVTMRMVTEDHDLTGSVVRQIELPRPAADQPPAADASLPGRSAPADGRADRPEGGRPDAPGRPAMAPPERPAIPGARPGLERPDRSSLPERPQLPELPDAARGQRPDGLDGLRDALPVPPGRAR